MKYKYIPKQQFILAKKKLRLHFDLLMKGLKGQVYEENCQKSIEITDIQFS